MLKLFRRLSVNDSLIILIIVIGAFLRFYRFADIPFTYDEFSAIIRTRFDSFHDLVEYGIKIDGHPAGVQVLLYYMTKIFGVSEVILKTPFLLAGILSVWIVYLIGKDWFNATVGLVSASFLSFLQYPVMYSQIARPYATGLCFALMMVFFWTKVIFHPERKYYLNLAGYVISGVLCTYNHHFSMLFAAMVGITGLFYCQHSRLRQYIIAGLMVIILYVPHLSILFHQLGIGGVEGWLSKPRYDFIFDYIQYVFHFSVYIYLLILVLVSLSLYWYQEQPPVKKKFILISLLWFLLPYLIGFFYSKYRNSVLQYSVLIFSFPFLLFVLFGFFKTVTAHHKMILVTLIGVIVIPSLIFERQHFNLFYKGVFGEMVKESKRMVDSLGSGRCKVILDTKAEINEYYLKKLNCQSLPFSYFDGIKGKSTQLSRLDSCKADFLAFGSLSSTNLESYPIIMEKYPFLIWHKSYFGGDFYLFSRIKPKKVKNEYFHDVVNKFEPSLPEWGWVNDKQCLDSLTIDGEKSFANTDGAEFSPAYTTSLRGMIHSENDVIDVSVDMRTPLVFPLGWLVLSITSEGKNIRWMSVGVNDYMNQNHRGRVFLSVRLSDVEFRHHHLMFSAYIWNPMKLTYIMDNFTIKVRSGNPVVYGLYRKISQYISTQLFLLSTYLLVLHYSISLTVYPIFKRFSGNKRNFSFSSEMSFSFRFASRTLTPLVFIYNAISDAW
jgi:hypothetical protein